MFPISHHLTKDQIRIDFIGLAACSSHDGHGAASTSVRDGNPKSEKKMSAPASPLILVVLTISTSWSWLLVLFSSVYFIVNIQQELASSSWPLRSCPLFPTQHWNCSFLKFFLDLSLACRIPTSMHVPTLSLSSSHVHPAGLCFRLLNPSCPWEKFSQNIICWSF